VLGFPIAVFKKFGEDRAGQLAALIAYYGFFSLFPLLLALVTFSALVFGKGDTSERILDAALAQFPFVGDRLQVQALPAKGVGLAIGLGGALWAGLGALKAAQNAMDTVWDVPRKEQPNFVMAILRASLMLVVLGAFVLAASALAGLASGTAGAELGIRLAGMAASVVLNVIAFLVAFRVLTVADVSWRDVLPGAVIAGIGWSVLQSVGGFLVSTQISRAGRTYGFFATVIGLLTWMYLAAQLFLLAAEVNVVRARRLWPRALAPEDVTEADRAALRRHAKVEERREDEEVDVELGGRPL
jgi:YihY family inner membrane protein